MALRTVSNTGGNWNATTTWVGGVVPIAGDDVNFTATSGNLTVNVSTANLVGINFTNYVGTITFNNPINTSGIVNLGTGGYTQDGTNGLVINGTTTISGSTIWSRTLTFTGTSITYTLGSNLTITGTISLSGTTASTFNGNTLNIGGSLTVTTAATVSGTTAFVFNGTGTWSHTAAGVIRNNVTINTAGTLTIGTNIYYDTGTLTHTAGTVTTTGSTLNIYATTTLNTGAVNWNNVTIAIVTNIASTTITLSSNFNVTGIFALTMTTGVVVAAALLFSGIGTLNPTGALTINAAQNLAFTITLSNSITITNLTFNPTGGINSNITVNGNSINVTGNLALTGTVSIAISGTTNINLIGIGTWSNTTASGLRNNLTINTVGTITISGNVYYNTGVLTYTTGTVITTGSTLNIGASTTLNVSGINWNNINITSGTQTLTSNLNIGGNLSLTGTITGAFTVIVIGNLTTGVSVNNVTSTTVSGSLVINGASSGTSPITLNGTGTWSATSYLSNNLIINTPGTITVSGNVYYTTGTFTYTSGTVTTTGSTLNIGSTTTLNTGIVNWNNVTIITSISASTLIITLLSNLNISGAFVLTMNTTAIVAVALSFSGVGTLNPSGTLTINAAQNLSFTITLPNVITITNLTFNQTGGANANITINSNAINATGNLAITGSATVIISGTTNINLVGNGTWSNAVATVLRNNLTINTAGTITISGIVYYNTGTITYTAGTIISTGSTLFIGLATTFNTSGMTWNNVTLAGTQTLTSGLNVGGNLTTQTTAVVLSGVVNVNVSGSLAINVGTSGTATIILIGTGTWSATSYLSNSLTINTPGTITVSGNVYYQTGTLTYTAGTVITTGSTLNMSGVAPTLNTNTVIWNNVTINLTANATFTLSSNFNSTGTLALSSSVLTSTLSFAGIGLLNPSGALTINITYNGANGVFTITLPNTITVTNLSCGCTVTQPQDIVLNGNSINITGNLSQLQGGSYNIIVRGTTNLNLTGTGTWTGSNFFNSNTYTMTVRNNLTINTAGTITISTNVYYNTGILTYTTGTVVTSGSTLNITSASTLNIGGPSWNNIALTGTQTLLSNIVCTGTLSTGISTINGSFTITTNNLTIGGATVINTTSVTASGNLAIFGNTSGTSPITLIGTGTWSANSYVSNNLIINTPGTITVSGNVYYQTGTLTYTSGTVTTTGSTLNMAGVAPILNTSTVIWNNVVISISANATFTLSSNFNSTGTLSLTAINVSVNPTLSFTGVGLLNSSGALIVNNAQNVASRIFTITLPNTITVTNVWFGCSTATPEAIVLNGNSINITGNLTHLGNLTSGGNYNITVSGTTNLFLTGTGTWSATYLFNTVTYAMTIQNNLTINTSGTITVSGNVYYNTGILTYTAGTVNTATNSSTLNIGASTTLNTNGISWYNIGMIATSVITLTTNLTWTNNWVVTAGSISFAGVGILTPGPNVNIAFSGSSIITLPIVIQVVNATLGITTINNNSISISGNLVVSSTTNGTTPITMNGTGSWSGAGILGSTLTFNTSGTITISGDVYYNTSTLTYTAGTMIVTGSTLNITHPSSSTAVTVNTSGMTWQNIRFSPNNNGTLSITMTSNFNIGGDIFISTASVYPNGVITFLGAGIFSPSATSNLSLPTTVGASVSINSNTNITVNNFTVNCSTTFGSGTSLSINSFTLNLLGNLTLTGGAGNVGSNIGGTGTLAFIGNGTWSQSFGPIYIPGAGGWLNCIGTNIVFNTTGTINIPGSIGSVTSSNNRTITYVSGNINASTSTLYLGGGNVNVTFNTNTMVWGNIYYAVGSQNGGDNISLSSDLNMAGLLYFFRPSTSNSTFQNITGNGYKIYLASLQNDQGVASILGNATLVFNKTGYWLQNTTVPIPYNIEINTAGILNIYTIYYSTGTLTYTNGNVITKNYTVNLTAACTLINCHKIKFDRVVITSGIIITMNEFFTGSPALKATILPSSTTNYTIAFQDGFEKISRFIKLSRATISRPNQLTVITDKGNQGNNVGVKFAPNQLANGLPKNTPSTSTASPYGLQPSYLMTDPTLS